MTETKASGEIDGALEEALDEALDMAEREGALEGREVAHVLDKDELVGEFALVVDKDDVLEESLEADKDDALEGNLDADKDDALEGGLEQMLGEVARVDEERETCSVKIDFSCQMFGKRDDILYLQLMNESESEFFIVSLSVSQSHRIFQN